MRMTTQNERRVIQGAGLIVTTWGTDIEACDIILLGKRIDGQGWSLPGGKFDPNKDVTTLDTAYRECLEETGLNFRKPGDTPLRVSGALVGTIIAPFTKFDRYNPMIHEECLAVSDIYLEEICDIENTAYYAAGLPDGEFTELRWFTLHDALFKLDLFPTTRIALNVAYSELLGRLSKRHNDTTEEIDRRDAEWLTKVNEHLATLHPNHNQK